MLSFLIKNGFLNAFNERKVTPLMHAAINDQFETAKELIELGADVNLKSIDKKRTALYFACDGGNYEIAELLLNHGALQSATQKGSTPLHVACDSKMAQLLIDRGGDVNAKTIDDETAMHYAAHDGFPEYIIFLETVGLDVNEMSQFGIPLQIALTQGRISTAQTLLEMGSNVDLMEDRETVLAWLKENIDEADPEDAIRTRGDAYESVCNLMDEVGLTIDEAKKGNVDLFIEKLRRGKPFFLMQVIPVMPQKARGELTRWVESMKRDMRGCYVAFQSDAALFYPGPISECLRQMLLLPKETRSLLSHEIWLTA